MFVVLNHFFVFSFSFLIWSEPQLCVVIVDQPIETIGSFLVQTNSVKARNIRHKFFRVLHYLILLLIFQMSQLVNGQGEKSVLCIAPIVSDSNDLQQDTRGEHTEMIV